MLSNRCRARGWLRVRFGARPPSNIYEIGPSGGPATAPDSTDSLFSPLKNGLSSGKHPEYAMLGYAALLLGRVAIHNRPLVLAASVIFDCGTKLGCKSPSTRYLRTRVGHNCLRGQRPPSTLLTPRPVSNIIDGFPGTFVVRPSLPLRFRLGTATVGYATQHKRNFCTTRRCEAPPLIAAAVAMLKVCLCVMGELDQRRITQVLISSQSSRRPRLAPFNGSVASCSASFQ